MRLFFALASMFFLASCSATGPKFQALSEPQKDKALVYFVRPKSFTAATRSIKISINDVPFADIRNCGYTIAELKPGQYKFKQGFYHMFGDSPATKQVRTISAQLKSGDIYFAAFQASSEFGSGETAYIPVSYSPYLIVPIQVAFDFGFGFIDEGPAIEMLNECYYEEPFTTANK